MKKESRSNRNTSRRKFLTLNWSDKKKTEIEIISPQEIKTQKMLMADGTLVEVSLPAEIRSTNRNKATNREILEWRIGPQLNSK